jgi:hypothetical protein
MSQTAPFYPTSSMFFLVICSAKTQNSNLCVPSGDHLEFSAILNFVVGNYFFFKFILEEYAKVLMF